MYMCQQLKVAVCHLEASTDAETSRGSAHLNKMLSITALDPVNKQVIKNAISQESKKAAVKRLKTRK
jgi:hypothetical protein